MIHWLRAYPIVGFLVLTFVISYLIGMPALFAYSAWAPDQPPVLRTYLSRTLVVYGPGLAAILMVAIAHGHKGTAALLRRLIPGPGDLPWALVIVLIGVATSGLALAHAGVSTAQFTAAIGSAGGLLAVHFLLQILIVSIGEECNYNGQWYDGVLARAFDSLVSYDLEARRWACHAPMPAASMDHRGLLASDDRLVLIGGMNAGRKLTTRILEFELSALRDCREHRPEGVVKPDSGPDLIMER